MSAGRTPQLAELLGLLRNARDPWSRLRLVAQGARALSRLTPAQRGDLLRTLGLEGAEELAELAAGGDPRVSETLDGVLRSLESDPRRVQQIARDIADPRTRRGTLTGLAAHVMEVVTARPPAPPDAPAVVPPAPQSAATGRPAKGKGKPGRGAGGASPQRGADRDAPASPSRPPAPSPAAPRQASPTPGSTSVVAKAGAATAAAAAAAATAAADAPSSTPPPAAASAAPAPSAPAPAPAASSPAASTTPPAAAAPRPATPPTPPPWTGTPRAAAPAAAGGSGAAAPAARVATGPAKPPPPAAAAAEAEPLGGADGTGSLGRLRSLRRALVARGAVSTESLHELLDHGLASDWARRRALSAAFAKGVPAGLDEALALVARLASPSARRWALGDLAASRVWSEAEWERLLAAADGPAARRRLASLRGRPLAPAPATAGA